MHFFYESISLSSWVAFFALFAFSLAANEFARWNKWTGLLTFLVLPLILLFLVWPHTAVGTNMDNWFSKAKVVLTMSSSLMFIALRYSKRVQSWKWFLTLPAIILALNILDAVFREFEVATMSPGVVNDMFFMGGGWNIVNGIAGLVNILIICGWFGIYISKDKHSTMVWPDMTWFWILAYDLWNFTYAYNAVGDRSFYVFPVLISATFAAHFIRKGAWLQHRSFTLAVNQLFMFTFPAALLLSDVAVQSTWNPAAMWTLSITALVVNVAVLIYQIYTIVKFKKNPLQDELYTHLETYKEIIEDEKQYN